MTLDDVFTVYIDFVIQTCPSINSFPYLITSMPHEAVASQQNTYVSCRRVNRLNTDGADIGSAASGESRNDSGLCCCSGPTSEVTQRQTMMK
jgi:hypothetical protein